MVLDTKIEISIEPSSNLSHEQTPVAGASSVSQDESRGLNGMTSEDLNSLNKQVCEYACRDKWKDYFADYLNKQVCEYARRDKWKEAESIFNKYADMVRIPLTDKKDTALHVAVKAESINFVKGLVNHMTPKDLEIQNSDEYTAFSVAVISGNSDLVQILIEKNQERLPLIKTKSTLPVHWAAQAGHHKIVQDLSSKTLLKKMSSDDNEVLFFFTIEHDMFDVATEIFEECGAEWDIQEKYLPTLAMLALKPLEKDMKGGNNRGASWGDGMQLLKKVWLQLREKWKHEEISSLGSELWPILIDALTSGNAEAVKLFISKNPELLYGQNILHLHVNSNGQNILHYAVRQRHSSIVSYIFKKAPPNHVLHIVDDDGNNILHLAAYPLEKKENSSATTKMTREVAWFKEVEKKVPRELRTKRNHEGKTPKDIFQDKHKDLSSEVKNTAKGIADSGMLVAALVATIAFAAAVTIPGDKTSMWFTVFILANAAALFTSSACILSFLSHLSRPRFEDSEFVIALHPSLILQPILLRMSIVTMIISFVAASFLIFEHTSKWVTYVVASMGILTILHFLLFHFSIFETFLWSRFYQMQ